MHAPWHIRGDWLLCFDLHTASEHFRLCLQGRSSLMSSGSLQHPSCPASSTTAFSGPTQSTEQTASKGTPNGRRGFDWTWVCTGRSGQRALQRTLVQWSSELRGGRMACSLTPTPNPTTLCSLSVTSAGPVGGTLHGPLCITVHMGRCTGVQTAPVGECLPTGRPTPCGASNGGGTPIPGRRGARVLWKRVCGRGTAIMDPPPPSLPSLNGADRYSSWTEWSFCT